MIILCPIRDDEYPAYLECFIEDYAPEIISNYRLSLDDSRVRTKQEVVKVLP